MDKGRISFNRDQETNRISLLLVQSPGFFLFCFLFFCFLFFSLVSRFSFIRGWQVCLKMTRLGFVLNVQQNEQ